MKAEKLIFFKFELLCKFCIGIHISLRVVNARHNNGAKPHTLAFFCCVFSNCQRKLKITLGPLGIIICVVKLNVKNNHIGVVNRLRNLISQFNRAGGVKAISNALAL